MPGMTRDMDLIRQILIEVDAHQDPMRPFHVQAAGYSPDQIAYHVKLLAEAGYVDAMNFTTHASFDWRPQSLTWRGHEFLGAIRNDTVWQKLKAELKDRRLDAPLELVQQLASKLVASLLGLS